MVPGRRSRLSSAAMMQKPPQRKQSSLRKKAVAVASSLSRARTAAKQDRVNKVLERREIDKFLHMAEHHLPPIEEIESMTEVERALYMTKLAYANILRSSCTSRREIEDVVSSVLKAIQSGDIYSDDTAIEQTQTRVGDFLLGKSKGTSMCDTLVPATFDQTKAMKHLFNHVWGHDAEYTCFNKMTIDKKRAWKMVLGIRQKMTERLNKMIAPIFIPNEIFKKSAYDKAIGKQSSAILAKYGVVENFSTLPPAYLMETEFAMGVVIEVGLDKMIEEWAGFYFLEMPQSSIDSALIGILNSRAVIKSAGNINLHFSNIYEKLKLMRCEDDTGDKTPPEIQMFPYSQRGLHMLSDKEDTLEDKDQIEDDGESAPTKKKQLPISQKRAWLASFSDTEDESVELLEAIEEQPMRTKPKLLKPQLPYMKNKKRKREEDEKKKAAKKSKVDLLDGLPPLEDFD